MSLADKIANIAMTQVGVRETSNNGGDAIAIYQRATWLPVGAWPWCAAFVCYAIREAMKGGTYTFPRPQTAGAWDLENWCRSVDKSARLIKPATSVKRGDVVIYKFSHVGIATSDMDPIDDRVSVVEGNTNGEGSREGDGVYLKRRHLSKIRSVIRFTV
jgi:hypothetical protein